MFLLLSDSVELTRFATVRAEHCSETYQYHLALHQNKMSSCTIVSDFAALECMGRDCEILVPEDFVLNVVTNLKIRDKYQEFSFRDFVRVSVLQRCKIIMSLERFVSMLLSKFCRDIDIWRPLQSHPELRFCPGPNCTVIVRAQQNKAKRVTCSECKTTFW